MVDVFGRSSRRSGRRGRRGPPGPPGTSGAVIDLCRWVPRSMLNILQTKEDVCCLMITNTDTDLKYNVAGEITEWISRTNNHNAKLMERATGSTSTRQLTPNKFALSVDDNIYVVDNAVLGSSAGHFYRYICVTFLMLKRNK